MGELVAESTDRSALHPIVIEIRQVHGYRSKGTRKNGCAVKLADGSVCNQAKAAELHLGLPLSLNVVGSRGGYHTYNNFKEAWEEVLLKELAASGLPAGWHADAPDGALKIDTISAEGQVCFPIMRKDRDQGNFRWFIEKCLGDALVKGGYLIDDSYWPERHYEFGCLDITHESRVAYTRLMLFPS